MDGSTILLLMTWEQARHQDSCKNTEPSMWVVKYCDNKNSYQLNVVLIDLNKAFWQIVHVHVCLVFRNVYIIKLELLENVIHWICQKKINNHIPNQTQLLSWIVGDVGVHFWQGRECMG